MGLQPCTLYSWANLLASLSVNSVSYKGRGLDKVTSKVSFCSNRLYFSTRFCFHKPITFARFLPDIKDTYMKKIHMGDLFNSARLCWTLRSGEEVLEKEPAAASYGSICCFSDWYHHFLSTLHGLMRKKNFKWETSKNSIYNRPFFGAKMELQPKSVIFTTILLSTTQLVDFRRPWTSVLLECR